MKKGLLILFALIAFSSCKKDNTKTMDKTNRNDIVVNYPETKQVDTVTNYFGCRCKRPLQMVRR